MRNRIQGGKPIRIHADLDPQTVIKNWVFTWEKKYFVSVIDHTTYLRYYEDTTSFLKGWNSGLFVKFGPFPCSSWIQIRIHNTNPDLGEPFQCGSGFFAVVLFDSKAKTSTSRIRNTDTRSGTVRNGTVPSWHAPWRVRRTSCRSCPPWGRGWRRYPAPSRTPPWSSSPPRSTDPRRQSN